MKYCGQCANEMVVAVPPGDDRERHVCPACAWVCYVNPRVVVGALVAHGDRVLLCRRAIAPRRGLWTLPAGFLELGESTAEGAARETREEAGADVEVVAPLAHFDIPRIGQSYLMFRARPRDLRLDPGIESLEAAWTAISDIPWDALAFDAVRYSLRLFLDDCEAGRTAFHHGVLRPDPAPSSDGWTRSVLTDRLTVSLA